MKQKCIQQNLRLRVTAFAVILFLFTSSFAFGQATITTDQADYPPGSTVIITGSGFQPGDSVKLQVVHVDGDPDGTDPQYHEPWTVIADADGNFVTTWFVPTDGDAQWALLKATADGQNSGLHAEATFTDAPRTDTYPSSFSTFTGGTSYCLNATTSNLSVNWSNTICSGTQNGSNTNIPITIAWFKNTVNSTSGGTSVQTTNTNASTTSSTYSPPSSAAGTLYYYVTISWSAGSNCALAGSITTSATQQVIINPLPINKTPTAVSSSVCSGTSTNIQIASSEVGVNYQLRNNSGNVNVGSAVAGTGGTINLSTGNLSNATTFNVLATNATTSCSLQMSPTVTVTVNSLPNNTSSGFGNSAICAGDAGTLTFDAVDASFVAPYSIQYTDGNTTWSQAIASASATTFNVAVAPTVTTTYTLISITNGNNCTTTTGFGDATATITVRPTPTASIGGTTTVCQGGSSPNITFTNPQTLAVTVTYNINGGTNSTVNVGASTSQTVAAPTGTAGTFNYNLVSVAYQSAPNCSNSISGTAAVTVNARPTGVISGTQTICSGSGATLSIALTGTGPWNGTITGGIPFSGSISPITVSVNPSSNTTYTITALSDANCTSIAADRTGSAAITVRATATATITINGTNPICSGSSSSIKFTGPSMGVVTYTINDGPELTGNLNSGGNVTISTGTLTANTTYDLVSVAYGSAPDCSQPASGSVTVTVNQPPAFTLCPSNISVNNDAGVCTAVVNYTATASGTPAPTYTYSFSGATTIATTPGTGSGSTFNKGVTNVTITAHNSCSPDATCNFTVTVSDNEAPVLTGTLPGGASGNLCMSAATTAPSEASIAALYSDNCTNPITATLLSSSITGTDCSWTATYTYGVKDASNNAAADAVVIYTGGDIEAPTLTGTLPTGSTGLNVCYSNIPEGPDEADIAALYTDNCGTVHVTKSGAPTGDNCSWTVTYHYVIKDDCNNEATAVDITYSGGDTEAPYLTGTIPSGGSSLNLCYSAIPAGPTEAEIAPLYADNCGTVHVTKSGTPTGDNCSWTVTYHYVIKDDCNNEATAVDITYSGGDTEAPHMTGTIPSGGSNLNLCYSAIPAGPTEADIAALYADNCGTVHVTKSGAPTGDNCSWTVTYHYVIKDDCNNEATAVDIIYGGGDTEAPHVTGTIPSGGSNLNLCYSAIPTGPTEADIAALYADNCGAVHVTKSGAPTGDNCSWTVTYHYVIKDDCNNEATAVDIIYGGGDTEAPHVTGTIPSGGSNLNLCYSAIPTGPTEADIAALYADNCGTVHVTKSGAPSGDNCSWTVTYHYVIKDNCNNEATAVDITYSGGDTEAPHLTGTIPPGGSNLNLCYSAIPSGPTEADIAALYTDNCGTVHVTKSGTPTGNNCSWTVTYRYVIKDDCNNQATAVDIAYSGGDTEAPHVTGTIPSGESNLNLCYSAIPAGPTEADIAALYADNCGTVHVTKTGTPTGNNCSWTVTYHYVIKDDCNNQATAVDITYSGGDTEAPHVTGTIPSGGSNLNLCYSAIPAGPTEAQIAALYADNCGTVHVTKTGTPTGNNCSWTVTYHYVIKDDCNNEATAVDITYSGGDTEAPHVTGTIPSGGSNLNLCYSAIPAGPTEAQIAALYADNCGTVHVTKTGSPTGNNCSWTVTYHYVIKDDCNNEATAVDITYGGGDTQAPTLVGTIPAGQTGLNVCFSNIPAGPTEAQIAALYTDNCGTVHVTKTGSPTGDNCHWTVTYHYVIKDDCNNAATAIDITYSGGDTQAPTLVGTIPSGQTGLNVCFSNIPAGPTEAQIAALYTDNCGTVHVTKTGVPIGNNCSWSVTYHYVIKDDCNNEATAVDIGYSGGDTQDPAISNCKTSTTRVFDLGETNYTVQGTEFDVSATDNCNLSSLVYSLTGASSGSGTTLADVDLNGGTTTITWTATDGCGHTKKCIFDVTVNKRTTTIVYTGDGSEQYSDQQALTATLTDVLTGTPLSGKTVTFTIGTQSVSDGPGAPGNGTDASGVASSSLIINQNPALVYNVSTNFAGDATYIGSSDLDNFDITQEDATTQYTGGEFASTGTATATLANIRLSATLTDFADGNRGDIRNTKVRFKIQPYNCTSMAPESIVYTSWKTVSLVNLADATIGTAYLDSSFDIGSCNSKIFDVTVEVSNYYNGNLGPVAVTVAKSLDDFITGGGHLDFGAGTTNKSGGVYKSSDNSKANWGFNAKYNKNKTNLQGNINIIIRSGGQIYQVKGVVGGSNGSLNVNVSDPNNKKATLTAKANMINAATGLTVPYGSNATLELKMNDKGEPGANVDTYAITIWGSNNALLYSSNWSGTATNEVAINGGNIQVRSSTPAQTNQVARDAYSEVIARPEVVAKPFKVTASPNPTQHYFALNVEGSGYEAVQLKVFDISGKQVYVSRGSANQTYRFGDKFVTGAYIAEVRQGNKRAILKLIKN